MAEERHRTVVELEVDDRRARPVVDRVQEGLDSLHQTAKSVAIEAQGVGRDVLRAVDEAGHQAVARTRTALETLLHGRDQIGATRDDAGRLRWDDSGQFAKREGRGGLLGMAGGLGKVIGVAGAGQLASAALSASYAQTPAQPERMVEAIAPMGGAAMGALIGSIVPGLGTVLGGAIGHAVGSVVATSYGIDAQSVEARFSRSQQLIAMNEQMGSASLAGVTGSRYDGVRYGYGPREAAGLLQGYGQGVGYAPAAGGGDLFHLLRAGVGMGALSGYAGATAPGAGGAGGDAMNVASLAFAQGLRGAGIDRYMGALSSAAEEMAGRGLTLNLDAAESMLADMQATPGAAGMGHFQTKAVAGLERLGGGARDKLLQPYRGIADEAIMAEALNSSDGTVMGALKALEGMKPQDKLGAIKGIGGSATPEILAAELGIPSGMAQALAGGLNQGSAPAEIPMQGGLTLARTEAQGEANLFGNLSNKQANNLLEAMHHVAEKLDHVADKMDRSIH